MVGGIAGKLLRFHSHTFISTFRPRKRTPSASNRNRCSIAESPRSLISPPAPNTRCHGKLKPRRRIRATIRAAPGNPAAFATPPYVATFPRGIARIVRSILMSIFPSAVGLFFAAITPLRHDHHRDAHSQRKEISSSSVSPCLCGEKAVEVSYAAVRYASSASYSEG